jgi:hypothetical protein
MPTLRADEVKARWYAWAESELGGSPERLDAIASAALEAVAEGLDAPTVEAVARRAASAYDFKQGAPGTNEEGGEEGFVPREKPRRHVGHILVLFVLIVALVLAAAWVITDRNNPPPIHPRWTLHIDPRPFVAPKR